jgi:hypothetical protein
MPNNVKVIALFGNLKIRFEFFRNLEIWIEMKHPKRLEFQIKYRVTHVLRFT